MTLASASRDSAHDAPPGARATVGEHAGSATSARFWWALGLMGLAALTVRLLNVFVLRPLDQGCATTDGCFAINGDALYSHLQGELLAQGHGFASSFAYFFFGDIQPGAGDPPLYVLYLGLVSALHGSGGTGARVLGLTLLVVALTGVGVGVGRRRGGRTGRWAALAAGSVAIVVLVVAMVPGLGADRLGVARVEVEGGPELVLPDGETVARAASIDESAVTAHRLASGLAGVGGVVLLGLVGRRLAGDRAGLLAAGLAAVYPLLWINDAMVLSEALYVPMVALAMLAAYRFWDHPSNGAAALLGLTVALAGLTRAEALLLGVFMVLPLVWGRRRELGWVPAVGRLAVAAAVCLACVLPWVGYNLGRFEEPTTMTAGTGAVLSAGSCDVAYDGEFVGYYGASCFQQYVDQGWEVWPDPRAEESVRDVPSRRAALRYIREHLAEWPRVAWFRTGRLWYLYQPTQDLRLDYQVEGRGRTASQAGALLYAAVLPTALVGVMILACRRIPVSPLVAQAVVVTATAALTFGVTRYRVPADAAMVVAAAVAADALLRRWWPARTDGTIALRP
jgi:hypothetical protein